MALTPPAVTLQWRTAAHAEALFALLRDPRLYRDLDELPPISAEALRQRFARSASGCSPDGTEHWLNWVILESADEAQHVAGFVQATVKADGTASIAYVLGSAFQGRGLATAAAQQMIAILQHDIGVHHLVLRADRRNARSLRLAERLGFVPTPTIPVAAAGHPTGNDVLWVRSIEPSCAFVQPSAKGGGSTHRWS